MGKFDIIDIIEKSDKKYLINRLNNILILYGLKLKIDDKQIKFYWFNDKMDSKIIINIWNSLHEMLFHKKISLFCYIDRQCLVDIDKHVSNQHRKFYLKCREFNKILKQLKSDSLEEIIIKMDLFGI